MKIITPSVELIDFIDGDEVLKKIERCGRVCYQSEPKGQPEKFVRARIKSGHESVLEHVSLTFHIICDRAIQNELVRHRHASFTVESTRHVDYDELEVIQPPDIITGEVGGMEWVNFVERAESAYDTLRVMSVRPEQARAVLPLCLKSELYMTANLRSWRWILKLRTSKAAHPQMRQLMNQVLAVFKEKLPVIVEDINHVD